jgi:hypothetical protein
MYSIKIVRKHWSPFGLAPAHIPQILSDAFQMSSFFHRLHRYSSSAEFGAAIAALHSSRVFAANFADYGCDWPPVP